MFSRLFFPHIGGVEEHVGKICEQLIKDGHEVIVVTEQYDKKLKLKENVKGLHMRRIPVFHTKESRKKWVIWKWLWDNWKWWGQYDVLHVHDVFYWSLPFKIMNVTPPLFTTFHGWEGKYPPTIRSRLMRRLAQSLSRGTIAVGDYIDSWYGTDSTLVIYGATDKKKLPMPKNPGILIYGRLDKDNDIDLVLSALERVKDMKKEVKITFLGDGVYRRRAEKVGEVVGFSKKVEKCLMHASLVVSSSYLSMLDALAAGRQVVSVYSNPLKEQYLKKGPMAHLIHIAKDEDSLVQGIIDRLENLKINKQGSVFAKKQTWEKVAKEYLSLWQNKKLR